MQFGLDVRVLTGESSAAERASVFEALAEGLVDCILTTPEFLTIHADRFARAGRIGFLVIDEAHHIGEARAGHRRAYLSLRQGDRRFRAVHDPDSLYQGDIFYYTCIGEKDELQPVYDLFSGDSRYRCTLQQELYRPAYWCEIMPAKASKANAILKLKEMWHCSRIISFGDAVNDIPMFKISDECYAVENAVDELKAAATGVIGSNEEDGVAKWLLEHAALQ